MVTRNTPFFVVGGTVKIYEPRALEGKGKYYRIVYRLQGGYKDTTAPSELLAKSFALKFARGTQQGGDFRFQLSGNQESKFPFLGVPRYVLSLTRSFLLPGLD